MNGLPDYLLVTQIFPPAVGGSGVLLENVYSRIRASRVQALIDEGTCGRPVHSTIEILPTHIESTAWGLLTPASWRQHLRLARRIQSLAGHGRAIVHCGRAQPEAIPAYLASHLPGGPAYVFWAHGEDIAAALSSRQYSMAMRIVYGRASAAIANSRNTARLLEGTGWHHGSVEVVYPGVDSARFRPDARPLGLRQRLGAPDALILMSVARLQRRKGHDLVIRALPELLRQWPMTRYVIVGDGNERRTLEALTTSLGVERAVHFTGEVLDDDLPSYFAEADVFVLPTRVEVSDFEGFGIVFLEAAAAAKPSVGGRNGGVPEAIVEGETGMLVDQDDVATLTRILLQLLGSPELRRRLGEAGRRRAVRDFDWNDAARSVMKIHDRIAKM